MVLRGKNMLKRVLMKVGDKNLTPKAKESLEKCLPKSKVVMMSRAKRSLFAGKHIQFGNSVSEDGGNRHAGMNKHKLIEVASKDGQSSDEGAAKIEGEISRDSSRRLTPFSYVLAPDKLKVRDYISN